VNIPSADLELLYGIVKDELSTYGRLETHVAAQTNRGNAVLLEVDNYQLPQPAGAYRRQHARSCIAIDVLVPEATAVGYYHHDGYHTASGDDYVSIFRSLDGESSWGAASFPQAEVCAAALPRRRRMPCCGRRWTCCAAIWPAVRARTRSRLSARHFRAPRTTDVARRAQLPDLRRERAAPARRQFRADGPLRALAGDERKGGARYGGRSLLHDGVGSHGDAVPPDARRDQPQARRMPDCLAQLEAAYQGTVPALAACFGETVS
jgi:hypothetical protein